MVSETPFLGGVLHQGSEYATNDFSVNMRTCGPTSQRSVLLPLSYMGCHRLVIISDMFKQYSDMFGYFFLACFSSEFSSISPIPQSTNYF